MAHSYLQHFPRPLLDDLVKNRWLPVIGAGMSLNAELKPPAKMPLWAEMGSALANDLTDYTSSGVLDSISAYEHEFGRARLIERLVDILHLKDAQPGPAHRQFCDLPFDIVCTTNFDFLLEQQYGLLPKYIHPVVDEDQLSINTGNEGTLLLKLHGDLRHPKRLVVTEADYDAFLSSYPMIATYLANLLISKTAVFIGYSLDDPDFRQIWNLVSSRLGKTRRMAYAIVVNAKPGDIARFERRGVKVVNLPGSKENYGKILAATFRELGEYFRDNIVPASKVTEERPLRELLLPRDAPTRLCFFSLPLDLLPFYRERIFPVAEEVGLVPVTAEDVVTPGDGIAAKIDTLIDRASVMVVEVGTRWTRAELAMARARTKGGDSPRSNRQALEVILVASEMQELPPYFDQYRYVLRTSLLDDSEVFVEQMRAALADAASPSRDDQLHEPTRLLEAKEYRAAVIAAMTALEISLREALNKPALELVNRPMSLRQLIELATNQEKIPPVDRELIAKWTKLRNEAVHTNRPITRQEAKEVVEGVKQLLRHL